MRVPVSRGGTGLRLPSLQHPPLSPSSCCPEPSQPSRKAQTAGFTRLWQSWHRPAPISTIKTSKRPFIFQLHLQVLIPPCVGMSYILREICKAFLQFLLPPWCVCIVCVCVCVCVCVLSVSCGTRLSKGLPWHIALMTILSACFFFNLPQICICLQIAFNEEVFEINLWKQKLLYSSSMWRSAREAPV